MINKEKIIDQTLNILKKKGLVVFPSDTVYGLLTDASSCEAVKKLIAFKNRPPGKPISVFVDSFSMLKDIVFVSVKQERILKNILPGPFTVILKSKKKVCPLLESEKGSLGVRLVNYDLITDLVKHFKKPITATSANISGRPPCHSITAFLNQVPKNKRDLIDLIIDVGTLPKNKPSTVIDLTNEEIEILREGDIKFIFQNTFISKSETQTKKIAQKIISSIIKNRKTLKKPIIFLLKGELGVGKTIFAKGIGEFFKIKNIISPSFTIAYEYLIKMEDFKMLCHYDFYNIQEKEEFKYLGLESNLEKGNILIIEWGEKSGDLINYFKKKGEIILVEIDYLNKNERKIKVSSNIKN